LVFDVMNFLNVPLVFLLWGGFLVGANGTCEDDEMDLCQDIYPSPPGDESSTSTSLSPTPASSSPASPSPVPPPAAPTIVRGTLTVTVDAATPGAVLEVVVKETWVQFMKNTGFNPALGAPVMSDDVLKSFVTSVTATAARRRMAWRFPGLRKLQEATKTWSVAWELTVPGTPAALSQLLEFTVNAAQADIMTYSAVMQGVFLATGNMAAAAFLTISNFGVNQLYEAAGSAPSQISGRISIALASLMCVFGSTQARLLSFTFD